MRTGLPGKTRFAVGCDAPDRGQLRGTEPGIATNKPLYCNELESVFGRHTLRSAGRSADGAFVP